MPWPKTWREAGLRGLFLGVSCATVACSHDALPRRAALEEEKPAEEQQLQLPAYPRPENLAKIDSGPGGSFDFFVDTDSIEVVGKGDFRYTLVAKSHGGAINISYEGLRCLTRERRLYALGRPDGTWLQAKKSQWTPFSRTEHNQIHTVLSADYFCPDRASVTTVQEAVRAVKYGGRLNAPR
jgi:hypothetical protein